MKVRLFGKDLFEYSQSGDQWAVPSMNIVKESKFLPDFRGGFNAFEGASIAWSSDVATTSSSMTITAEGIKVSGPAKKPVERKKLTPKKVYELQMLHDKSFQINMDPKYLDLQINAFKEKLALIKGEEYDMRRGTEEVASILLRMENRKKYATVKSTFEKFPYTTNARIESVLKKHDYLRLGQVAQFVADMPSEATDAMKEYNTATEKLCGKKAVFYIIADKKDFEKTNNRRDPILLAQSPFGHFWQILGAWDKEMLFLEEL